MLFHIWYQCVMFKQSNNYFQEDYELFQDDSTTTRGLVRVNFNRHRNQILHLHRLKIFIGTGTNKFLNQHHAPEPAPNFFIGTSNQHLRTILQHSNH
jgi:hypothetical protein